MCPTPRRCVRSLTDGWRRWPLEPWDGLAARPGLLTTECWLPWHVSSRARRRGRTVIGRSRPRGGSRQRRCSPTSRCSTTAGRSSDPDRARELMANDPTDWREFRPDILGTVSVGHDGDAWTMAIYFTSEEAAREGEQKEPPPEMQEMMKEMDALTIGEPIFFDLKDPWLHAPG